MLRQCRNPKCIGSKKSSTNKEKEPTPPSTSRRSSSDNSTALRGKRKKRTKPKSKRSRGGSKNSRTPFNESRNCNNKKCHASRSTSESSYSSRKLRATSTRPNTFERVSDSSRDCRKQICTCRKERRSTRDQNLHGHANPRSTSVERNKKRRKRSRRRRKKTSKRESDRPRNDCFTTLCVCVRGRSSDELRACKCTSSHEIPCECYSIKDGQKETKQVTRRNALKNDTQVGGYTAGPSTSERKPLEHSRELSPAKPNEERSLIIRGLDIVRRRIHKFNKAIRLVTRQQ